MGKVLVIGDCIIDHDVFCESLGLSLETPTLKTKFLNERYLCGGSANVVEHLLSLGENVSFITNIAEDSFSQILHNFFSNQKINFLPIKCDGENTVKTRYWIQRGDSTYKYLQLNRGSVTKAHGLYDNVNFFLEHNNVDKVIFVDYGNGIFFDEKEVNKIFNVLKKRGIKIISSSQKSDKEINYHIFKNSDVICMNENEMNSCFKSYDKSNVRELSEYLNSDICVTKGKNGSEYHTKKKSKYYEPYKVNCVDSCGAGDAFLASFSLNEDCDFANMWAAISVTKLGTEVPKLEELSEF